MIFSPTKLKDSYVIDLQPIADERGWFSRYFCKNEFSEIGHSKEWVQMNHSVSYKKGTVRGMHYQMPPFSEVKLVRCIAGVVFDVIVDLRNNSATFLQWFGVELSASNKTMIYIPEGFAHGFQCLSENCELLYHHTEFYKPDSEAGLLYNDPMINIEWPLPVSVVSERDRSHLFLNKEFKGI